MNLFGKLQNEYENQWKQVIRPTRTHYSDDSLGPSDFTLEGVKVNRQDFQLTSIRDFKFQGSIWLPVNEPSYACVIYLHSGSGNRTQCMEYLGKILKQKIALCSFDFCGCGNAEGDYITMGYFQQQDIKEVANFISNSYRINSLAIWGKNLGAVSALLYLGKTLDVKAVVLDSPYKNVKSYIEQQIKKNLNVPSLVMGGAVKIVSKAIEEKGGFQIGNINPLKYTVAGLQIPALFVCPMEDEYLTDSCKKLFDSYAGQNKQFFPVNQKEQDSRTEECVNKCVEFLGENMGQKPSTSKKEFDFFDSDDFVPHKKQNSEKEVKVDVKKVSDKKVEAVSQVQEKKESESETKQKHKSQFSFKGIFSYFSGKNEAQKEQIKQIDDSYRDLRKVMAGKHTDKGGKWSQMQQLMKRDLSNKRRKIEETDLSRWIYASVIN